MTQERKEQHHPETNHYTVDGEPQKTTAHELSIAQILKAAEKDPENHYLILLDGHKQISYEHTSQDTVIPLHNGMRFIAPSRKPTPVS